MHLIQPASIQRKLDSDLDFTFLPKLENLTHLSVKTFDFHFILRILKELKFIRCFEGVGIRIDRSKRLYLKFERLEEMEFSGADELVQVIAKILGKWFPN